MYGSGWNTGKHGTAVAGNCSGLESVAGVTGSLYFRHDAWALGRNHVASHVQRCLEGECTRELLCCINVLVLKALQQLLLLGIFGVDMPVHV